MNATEVHANRKFAETSFGRIAYLDQGASPATLFIHGLPLCGYEWRGVIADPAPA
jgi:haloalkane dehalogenase